MKLGDFSDLAEHYAKSRPGYSESDWDIFRKLTQISDEEISSMDTTQIISRMIVAGIKFKNIKYFGEWVEVDTLNDLLIFENLSNEL